MADQRHVIAADHITDLVRGFTTHEAVRQPLLDPDGRWRTRVTIHTLTFPPLLDQLAQAVTGASARADEDAGQGGYRSKPAAHIEAIDTLARIDKEARTLAVSLELDSKRPLKEVVRSLSGKVGDKPDPTIRRWWAWARLATQWDTRPFQPAGAPCPNCWEVKTLRIDLGNDLARCTACGRVWDGPSAVAILAQHVKWSTDHEITKPDHIVTDEHDKPISCPECRAVRRSYAEWRSKRAQR